MPKALFYTLFSISCALLTSACSTSQHLIPLASGTLYQCDHHTQMNIFIGQNSQNAALYLNGRDITLERAYEKGEPALIYTNGIYTLYHNGKTGKNARATLEREKIPYLSNCSMRL